MEKSAVVDNESGKSLDSECAPRATRSLLRVAHLRRSPSHSLCPSRLLRSIRTSSGMFLTRGQDEIIKRIEERIAAFSMVPAGVTRRGNVHATPCLPLCFSPHARRRLTPVRLPDHGEGIQVLHYEAGQKYEVCSATAVALAARAQSRA
jgi:hypothetical protein